MLLGCCAGDRQLQKGDIRDPEEEIKLKLFRGGQAPDRNSTPDTVEMAEARGSEVPGWSEI